MSNQQLEQNSTLERVIPGFSINGKQATASTMAALLGDFASAKRRTGAKDTLERMEEQKGKGRVSFTLPPFVPASQYRSALP